MMTDDCECGENSHSRDDHPELSMVFGGFLLMKLRYKLSYLISFSSSGSGFVLTLAVQKEIQLDSGLGVRNPKP